VILESASKSVLSTRPRIPQCFVSNSLQRVALISAVGGGVVDVRRISFQVRCIYLWRCENPFGVAALGASQVSADVRFNFVASCWFD
jgi:hypothetical protein